MIYTIGAFRGEIVVPHSQPIPGNETIPLELTAMGLRQEYIEGRDLRDRYPDLISENYEVEEIFVRSTNLNRTIMSAQAQMMGLYASNPHKLNEVQLAHAIPPVSLSIDPRIISELHDSPLPFDMEIVPIHVYSAANDMFSSEGCPMAKQDNVDTETKSAEVVAIIETNKALIEDITTTLGFLVEEYEWPKFREILWSTTAALFNQDPLPLTQKQIEDLNGLANQLYPFRYEKSSYLTLLSSRCAKEINDTLEKTKERNSLENVKFEFVSLDYDVFMAFLHEFDIAHEGITPFGANFIIEVYSSPNTKQYLRGTDKEEEEIDKKHKKKPLKFKYLMQEVKLPGCGDKDGDSCTIGNFYKLVKTKIKQGKFDYKKDCQIPEEEEE